MTLRTPWALLPLFCAVVACDSPSDGGDPPAIPASLTIVSGDEQSGTVGQELGSAMVVRVTDDDGDPIEGQLVNFRVASGGGSVFAGSALTNQNGEARERWTLGTVAADSQRMEARAVDPTNGSRIVFAVFRAVAVAGPATSVQIQADSVQVHRIGGTALLHVSAADQFGNPANVAALTWSSSNTGVATVAAGQVTGVTEGRAWARAALGALQDSARVIVAEQLVYRDRHPTLGMEIFLANADGTGRIALSNEATDQVMPAWSPDGTQVAYLTHAVGGEDLTLMNADGSGKHVIAHINLITGVEWAPNSSKILLRIQSSGLWVINPDGTGLTQLTSVPAGMEPGFADYAPAWSNDGAKIVFVRSTFVVDSVGDAEFPRQTATTLWIMNADGSNPVQLTSELTGQFDNAPHWSPDGSRILFSSFRGDGDELYTIRPDGTGLARLSTRTGQILSGRWSPGGNRIAFMYRACTQSSRVTVDCTPTGEPDGLYVMNADGTSVTLLAAGGSVTTPNWRP